MLLLSGEFAEQCLRSWEKSKESLQNGSWSLKPGSLYGKEAKGSNSKTGLGMREEVWNVFYREPRRRGVLLRKG